MLQWFKRLERAVCLQFVCSLFLAGVSCPEHRSWVWAGQAVLGSLGSGQPSSSPSLVGRGTWHTLTGDTDCCHSQGGLPKAEPNLWSVWQWEFGLYLRGALNRL